MMKRILVYCGANAGKNPVYKNAAIELGKYLVKNNYELVYGGGSLGLMGILADTVLENNGTVIGIIPNFLDKLEVGHKNLTETYKVNSMHERKALMEEKADAIITLPGGYGSMDELFEILSWAQLNIHSKPVGLLNVANYYGHLIEQLDHMVEEGFLKKENRNLLIESDTIENLFAEMKKFKPGSTQNWIKI